MWCQNFSRASQRRMKANRREKVWHLNRRESNRHMRLKDDPLTNCNERLFYLPSHLIRQHESRLHLPIDRKESGRKTSSTGTVVSLFRCTERF